MKEKNISGLLFLIAGILFLVVYAMNKNNINIVLGCCFVALGISKRIKST